MDYLNYPKIIGRLPGYADRILYKSKKFIEPNIIHRLV